MILQMCNASLMGLQNERVTDFIRLFAALGITTSTGRIAAIVVVFGVALVISRVIGEKTDNILCGCSSRFASIGAALTVLNLISYMVDADHAWNLSAAVAAGETFTMALLLIVFGVCIQKFKADKASHA